MNKLTSILAVLLLFAACARHASPTDVHTMTSPSGNMTMTFQLSHEGTPQYALNFGSQKVILPSDLGYEFRGVLKAQQIVYNEDGTIASMTPNCPEAPEKVLKAAAEKCKAFLTVEMSMG